MQPGVAAPSARVVVLGHNGFVGRSLTRHLSSVGRPWIGIGRETLDLTADVAADLAGMLRGDDVLVVLSAISPKRMAPWRSFAANIRIAENICAALQKQRVAQVVYVSSEAVYPAQGGAALTEGSDTAPSDLYGMMHLARERMLEGAAASTPLAIVRPVMLLGVDDPHGAYGPNRFVRQALKDGAIQLYGMGEDVRDYLAVDDLSRIVSGVIDCGARGVLNAASGQSLTASEASGAVFAALRLPEKVQSMPRTQPASGRSYNTDLCRRLLPHLGVSSSDAAIAKLARTMQAQLAGA